SRRRHTRWPRDWSSDVCSSDLTPESLAGQSDLVRRIRDLREELNWYYHRIELEQLRPEEQSHQRLGSLQEKAQLHEKELMRTLRSEERRVGKECRNRVGRDR